MYNRYIPQPDGSFQRSRMPDRRPRPQQPCPPPPEKSRPPKEEAPCENKPPQSAPHCPPPPPEHPHRPPEKHDSVSGFLRQLIPKDFDTGDLIVVLLLLLLAGDCEEDRNTALLTLALYLFM